MLRIYKGIEIFHLRQEVIINILLQALNMLFIPALWQSRVSNLLHEKIYPPFFFTNLRMRASLWVSPVSSS